MARLRVGTEHGLPVELHYDLYGEGRPVVLIHGWPLSSRAWEAQVPALVEAGHSVLTYDRRGFGASSQPWSGYDYDTFTADLHALLEHLDLRDATLVGFSMGGGEVVRYVATHGTDRVSRAALLGAVPPYLLKTEDNPDGGVTEELIAGMEGGVRGDRLAFLDEFTRTFFSADGELKVSEPQRRYAATIGAFASPKGTLDCIAAFCRTDFRAEMAKVSVPTLVLHGDSDAIVPFEVSGERAAQMLPDSSVAVVKGAPHGLLTSHPQEVNAGLLDFLRT